MRVNRKKSGIWTISGRTVEPLNLNEINEPKVGIFTEGKD